MRLARDTPLNDGKTASGRGTARGIDTRVESAGQISDSKGVNIPACLPIPAMTAKGPKRPHSRSIRADWIALSCASGRGRAEARKRAKAAPAYGKDREPSAQHLD